MNLFHLFSTSEVNFNVLKTSALENALLALLFYLGFIPELANYFCVLIFTTILLTKVISISSIL